MVALVGGIGWIGSGGIPRESGGGARVGSLEIRGWSWFRLVYIGKGNRLGATESLQSKSDGREKNMLGSPINKMETFCRCLGMIRTQR